MNKSLPDAALLRVAELIPRANPVEGFEDEMDEVEPTPEEIEAELVEGTKEAYDWIVRCVAKEIAHPAYRKYLSRLADMIINDPATFWGEVYKESQDWREDDN